MNRIPTLTQLLTNPVIAAALYTTSLLIAHALGKQSTLPAGLVEVHAPLLTYDGVIMAGATGFTIVTIVAGVLLAARGAATLVPKKKLVWNIGLASSDWNMVSSWPRRAEGLGSGRFQVQRLVLLPVPLPPVIELQRA